MIPYGHQFIDRDDIEEVVKVLKSDWLTQGPRVLEFEKKLAEYCGAKYAVATNNGTAALHLAYLASGLGGGDEVITTPNTFVATTNMLLACGAKPVFCDIRLDTYNMDEEMAEELITDKTKAIVPVHFAGQPCEMDRIHEIAKKYNLLVIEDACHALGAVYKNRKIGSLSDMTVFSFHPVKTITTGEGGAVTTDNEEYYKKMIEFRNHGMTKEPRKLSRNDGPWYYEIQSLGYNYRITDIQCALGISQLKKIELFNKKRNQIANYYIEGLGRVKGVILPKRLVHNWSSWHLFVVRFEESIKKNIFESLLGADIGAQVHYIPIYKHPYYKNNGFENFKLKNTEKYYKTGISLPIYPQLKEEQLDYIIEKIKFFN